MPSMFGRQIDDNVVQGFAAKLESKLEGYEVILSKQQYLSGDVSILRFVRIFLAF
jgi:hypothetical protein